jgi:hypothetical protein
MFCSSGLSRPPNGSPYSIPISRSAAARPSSPATAYAPQDLRRSATDEVGDLLRVDQHRVDAGALERDDVVASRGREVGDHELPGRHVGQQVEDPLDVVLVVLRIARREQEDLRVDALQGGGERILVVHVGDDFEPELGAARVEVFEVLLVVVLLDHDQARVGAGVLGDLGGGVRAKQDRQRGRVSHPGRRRAQREALGALLLRSARGVGVAHEREDRDSVPL